jgi:hypothetical protein
MKFKSLVSLVIITISGNSFAASANDTITMHSAIVETPDHAFATIDRINLNPEVISGFSESSAALAEADVILDQIINMGKKVWDIVKANRPVTNVQYDFANALPKGLTSSAELSDFSNVQSSSVRIWGTNGFGVTVYDVTLTAVHQFGGQYEGKGRYLETVSVVPSNLNVLWGYTVDYSVTSVSALNAGTRLNPVSSIALHAKFKVSTILKSDETNTVYQFRGDSAEISTTGI